MSEAFLNHVNLETANREKAEKQLKTLYVLLFNLISYNSFVSFI